MKERKRRKFKAVQSRQLRRAPLSAGHALKLDENGYVSGFGPIDPAAWVEAARKGKLRRAARNLFNSSANLLWVPRAKSSAGAANPQPVEPPYRQPDGTLRLEVRQALAADDHPQLQQILDALFADRIAFPSRRELVDRLKAKQEGDQNCRSADQ